MPLPIAHSLLGASIVALIHPRLANNFKFPLITGAILANSADFDFALVFLLGSKEWHRGFSHSILFAVIFLLTILLITGFQKLKEGIAYGLAFASHFMLDFVTTKIGSGVELFWFFSHERFGLRWFGLSEMPSKLSAGQILGTILLELIIFAPLFGIVFYLKKRRIYQHPKNQ